MQLQRDEDEERKVLESVTEGVFFGFGRTLRRYSPEEIEAATESFSASRKIGEGGFGRVYKAVLGNTPVAIKALREDALGRRDEFLLEVELLSQLRHPNLLLLLGACPETGCLVYDFMHNGSLEDKLFRHGGTAALPWFARVRVLLEVARALAFLHGAKPDPLVHRDLKPCNILLDRNLVAKIGDVGLARLLSRVVPDGVTEYRDTVLAGTVHYMDPEYQKTGTLRPRSDLYAFGVVALQVLTGAPPVGLATVVGAAVERGRLLEVMDGSVPDWPLGQAEELARLGLGCCRLRCRDRPDLVDEVLPRLARLAELAESSPRVLDPAPCHFFCPILQALMENPYIAADGFSYEHKAIRDWIEKQRTSPVTKLPLPHTRLAPNHALRRAILYWKSALTAHHHQP
ncbi:U-box domain-containing protein 34-like [Wolffia australiana]